MRRLLKMIKVILKYLGIVILFFLIAYPLAIRPWHVHWGATREEFNWQLPGDELVPEPRMTTTRAITIQAPASDVWPWLVQIGQGRGGLYSYDWLENLLGLNIHSADSIVAGWQHLAVGDTIHLASEMGMAVARLDPQRALVFHAIIDMQTGRSFDPAGPLPEDHTRTSWAFYLDEIDARTTRLIARFQLDYKPTFGNMMIWRLLTEPGHFIMERKMLKGIKERAEKT